METMNRGIITSLSAIGVAQALKIITHKKLSGRWDLKQAFTTGGMPSSHSAGVSALASYVAANKGTGHTETALAVVFGMIVMYDAQGIRRHTGEIARLVNELEDSIVSLNGDFPSLEFEKRDYELKELLGHQPIEVVGGAIFGTLVGLLSANYENNERHQKKRALKKSSSSYKLAKKYRHV